MICDCNDVLLCQYHYDNRAQLRKRILKLEALLIGTIDEWWEGRADGPSKLYERIVAALAKEEK